MVACVTSESRFQVEAEPLTPEAYHSTTCWPTSSQYPVATREKRLGYWLLFIIGDDEIIVQTNQKI